MYIPYVGDFFLSFDPYFFIYLQLPDYPIAASMGLSMWVYFLFFLGLSYSLKAPPSSWVPHSMGCGVQAMSFPLFLLRRPTPPSTQGSPLQSEHLHTRSISVTGSAHVSQISLTLLFLILSPFFIFMVPLLATTIVISEGTPEVDPPVIFGLVP